MSTTKKKAGSAEESTGEAPAAPRPAPFKPRNVAAYDAAVEQFASASALFLKGQFGEARSLFEAVAKAATPDEPILADRARTYASICAARLNQGSSAEGDADTLYHRGVVAANAGNLDEGWSLLEKAASQRPNDA